MFLSVAIFNINVTVRLPNRKFIYENFIRL